MALCCRRVPAWAVWLLWPLGARGLRARGRMAGRVLRVTQSCGSVVGARGRTRAHLWRPQASKVALVVEVCQRVL